MPYPLSAFLAITAAKHRRQFSAIYFPEECIQIAYPTTERRPRGKRYTSLILPILVLNIVNENCSFQSNSDNQTSLCKTQNKQIYVVYPDFLVSGPHGILVFSSIYFSWNLFILFLLIFPCLLDIINLGLRFWWFLLKYLDAVNSTFKFLSILDDINCNSTFC